MRAEGRTIAAILTILMFGGCAGTRQGAVPEGPHLRVMTYNVNYGLPPNLGVEIIENSDADVVCLQETTPLWEQSLRQRLTRRYPHMLFQE